jgi:hypothetical protein
VSGNFRATLDWLRVILPPLLIAGFAGVVFRDAVMSSIEATPYPELVYMIFVAFALAIFLCWMALYAYKFEERVFKTWYACSTTQRVPYIASLRGTSILNEVYNIVNDSSSMSARARDIALQSELAEFDSALAARLVLPTYLGGSLIGLGLIGTFIGLLGTLSELSSLFSVLTTNPTEEGVSQAEMFQNMIERLQAPMSGMGTAFVTSLYGLVGSIVVGYVILNTRRVSLGLSATVKRGLREFEDNVGLTFDQVLQDEAKQARQESERWQALYENVQAHRQRISLSLPAIRGEITTLAQSISDLVDSMQASNEGSAKVIAALEKNSRLGTGSYAALSRIEENMNYAVNQLAAFSEKLRDVSIDEGEPSAEFRSDELMVAHRFDSIGELRDEIQKLRISLETFRQEKDS